MNKKNIGTIINLINKLENCDNLEDFYKNSTKMYYYLNSLVFNLENEMIEREKK